MLAAHACCPLCGQAPVTEPNATGQVSEAGKEAAITIVAVIVVLILIATLY